MKSDAHTGIPMTRTTHTFSLIITVRINGTEEDLEIRIPTHSFSVLDSYAVRFRRMKLSEGVRARVTWVGCALEYVAKVMTPSQDRFLIDSIRLACVPTEP